MSSCYFAPLIPPYERHYAQVIEGGEPVIVSNQDGQPTTPSVVAFRADGTVLVGAQAKRQAATNPGSNCCSTRSN